MPAEQSVGFSFSWIARLLRTRFDARARSIGLTRAQWTMIVTIYLCENSTQRELAAQLEINTVTAGRILERLEAAGWIDRRTDPADRRINRISLTDAARPMFAKLQELGAEEEAAALRGFSTAERATLASLLHRVIANMTE